MYTDERHRGELKELQEASTTQAASLNELSTIKQQLEDEIKTRMALEQRLHNVSSQHGVSALSTPNLTPIKQSVTNLSHSGGGSDDLNNAASQYSSIPLSTSLQSPPFTEDADNTLSGLLNGEGSESYHHNKKNDLMRHDKVAMTSTVEMLRSLLRQREGEITILKQKTAEHQTLKQNLASAMQKQQKYVTDNESLKVLMKQLKVKLHKLTLRHELGLQMIAEREQEIEYLKEEMVNMKELFQEQLKQLIPQE